MTREVFNYLAPKIIYGCGTVQDVPAEDINNQTEEGGQVDENGTTEEGSKTGPIESVAEE